MSYYDISVIEAEKLLASADLTVIDMRDGRSRRNGELPGAQSPNDDVIGKLVLHRRSDPAVLVYCYHGNSSRDLCSFLVKMGLKRVYNLVGGWAEWENWLKHRPSLASEHKFWLKDQGFDPENLNSRVDMGMSPLMLAALKGEYNLVDALLVSGADPRQVNDDEHHALWFACVNGSTELVEKLIECGSDIDNRNVNGVTCAIYAASTGKLDVLKILIDAGANLQICTHDGVSVLESASTLPVLRFLRSILRQAS